MVSALFPNAGAAFARDLSGTYVLTSQNITMTLMLRQDAQGTLGGTLSSTSGVQFQIEGMVQEGVGIGACVGTQGGSYFEARPDGDRLLFTIIELGPNNAPDYNRVQKLLFARQTSESGVSDPAAVGPPPPGSAGPSVPAGLSGNEVSDPSWSFAFTAPSGWKQQKSDQGAILRHDTIPGLILVLPHEAPNLPELQWSMQQGFQDQNIELMLAGGLEQVGHNTIAGDYNGIAQGSPVQARWIGVLESQGGGAYVIAIAPRQVYGKALTTAAETVVGSLRGVQRDASDLVAHFAGTWVTMTRNTQTMVALYPNGTFAQRYEAGYSGGQTGSWGFAREDHAQGRWAVRGTKQQGVLVLTNQDGSQNTVRYQVHVERGQTYWREYLFNGELYGKQ